MIVDFGFSDRKIASIIDEQFKALEEGVSFDAVLTVACSGLTAQRHARATVVSIVGGAGSGKTTLADGIRERLSSIRTEVICTDDYVIGSREFRDRHLDSAVTDPLSKYDFKFMNHLVGLLAKLRTGACLRVPVYDEESGMGVPVSTRGYPDQRDLCRAGNARIITGPIDVLIAEGDFQPLHHPDPDLVIYLHVPDRIRLMRRIARDVSDRSYIDEVAVRRSFELRERVQHRRHTLPLASESDLLVRSMGTEIDDCRQFDIFRSGRRR